MYVYLEEIIGAIYLTEARRSESVKDKWTNLSFYKKKNKSKQYAY